MVAGRPAEAAASGDPPSLGMLMDWKVAAEGQRTKLWISTDDGGAYLFTVDTVEGKPRNGVFHFLHKPDRQAPQYAASPSASIDMPTRTVCC